MTVLSRRSTLRDFHLPYEGYLGELWKAQTHLSTESATCRSGNAFFL